MSGATPDELPFLFAATVDIHYTQTGSFWPIGGPSEIPFNMIPVIERSGGRAFVNASVEKILFEAGRATGVSVGGNNIYAPHIISTIGLFETAQNLIPAAVVQNSQMQKLVSKVQPGLSVFYAFIILDGTKEDLGLNHATTWHFEHQDLGNTCKKWLNKDVDEALLEPLPEIAIGSNSAKDPYWERNPNHVGKSTISAMIPANWDWFDEFKNAPKDERGSKYEKIKMSFGNKIMEKIFDLHPQLRGRVEYTEFQTPLSHADHLGKHKGGIYGLRPDMPRYQDPGICSAVVFSALLIF